MTAAGVETIEGAARDTWPGGRDVQRRRVRRARLHLEGFAGQTWQQRWQASGLVEPGGPVGALAHHPSQHDEISVGACAFSLRVIRPSLLALSSPRFLGYGERFLAAQNDALLDFWAHARDVAVQPIHPVGALFDVTAALTTQGIALGELTPEAFLHYVCESRDHGLNFKARAKHTGASSPDWPGRCCTAWATSRPPPPRGRGPRCSAGL